MRYFVKGTALCGDGETPHDVEVKVVASTAGAAVKEACRKIGEKIIAVHNREPMHVSIIGMFDIIGNSYEWVEKPPTLNVAIRGMRCRGCKGYWRVAL